MQALTWIQWLHDTTLLTPHSLVATCGPSTYYNSYIHKTWSARKSDWHLNFQLLLCIITITSMTLDSQIASQQQHHNDISIWNHELSWAPPGIFCFRTPLHLIELMSRGVLKQKIPWGAHLSWCFQIDMPLRCCCWDATCASWVMLVIGIIIETV